MRAALWTLALLVGARADSSEYEEGSVQDRRPSIFVANAADESRRVWHLQYGEDAIIYCSSTDSSANLTIRYGYNEQYLKAVRLNTTTVRLQIERPDVGKHVYRCTDHKTGYYDNLWFSVIPLIFLSSPRVRFGRIVPMPFVPLEDDYEVFCKGNNAQQSVHISREDRFDNMLEFIELPTTVVNRTMVVHKARADRIEDALNYKCLGTNDEYDTIAVMVNYYPEAQGVSCISYHRRKLECTWKSLNKNNIFKMYLYNELIWQDKSGDVNRIFSWDFEMNSMIISNVQSFNILHFTLQTCNQVFCDNQTFTVYHETILKFDPPSELRILNTTAKGVAVAWRHVGIDSQERLVHRLEYRLLGSAWQVANTSSVRCNDTRNFEYYLDLRCPNAHYEVRLYVRSEEATEERFWSEPASLFFFTKRRNTRVSDSDPECYQKPNERKLVPSVEDMLHRAELLIAYVREKSLTLQMHIEILKEKQKQVQELMELYGSV